MESVEGGLEIVSQTNQETRPHEFMILVRDEDEPLTPHVTYIASRQLVLHQRHSLIDLKLHQPPTQPCLRPRMLYYVNCGILLSMYGPLIGLVQVKFQNNHETPFETHYLFMIMSVVAFSTSALSFRLLVYTTTTILPSIYFLVVTSVIIFLAILAPLSLVLVLFIPPRLIWIGYSVVCVLFISVVTYNFIDYISLFGNKISAIANVTKWFGVKG